MIFLGKSLRNINFLSSLMLVSLLPFTSEVSAETREILSPVYSINRIYKSMEGPQSTQQVTLSDEPPELVWITGFQTDMVGADGVTPSLPEFMCHVNLDLNVGAHKALMGSGTIGNSRILTLSQGQVSVHFPHGFGMPVMSNESLSLSTQVLNHNLEHTNFQVRHKITFDFVRDRALKKPLKPLFNTSVFGMKLLEGTDGHFNIKETDESKHGPSCLPGETAPNAHGGSTYDDAFCEEIHWTLGG